MTRHCCSVCSGIALVFLFFPASGNAQSISDFQRVEKRLEAARMEIQFSETNQTTPAVTASIRVTTGKDQVFVLEPLDEASGVPGELSDGKRYVLISKSKQYASMVKDAKVPSPRSLQWLIEPHSANTFLTGHGLGNLQDVSFEKSATGETVVRGKTQQGYAVTAIVDPAADFVAKRITVDHGNAESTVELGPPMRAVEGPQVASSSVFRLTRKNGALIREWKGKFTKFECGDFLGANFRAVIPAGWNVSYGPLAVTIMHIPKESNFEEIELLAQKQSILEKNLAKRNQEETRREESSHNSSWIALAIGVLLAAVAIITLRKRNT